MPGDEIILQENDRKKLDGIVQKMNDNKEKPENIQAVVNDFKSKYGVKKKENLSNLAVSPLGSLEKKQPPAQPSTVSGSGTPLPSPHESVFGAILPFSQLSKSSTPEKKEDLSKQKGDFISSPSTSEITDENKSLLGKTEKQLSEGLSDEDKQVVHEKTVNFRNNFFEGTLTPEDIDMIPGKLQGVTSGQAAEAINNKTKNLKVFGNVTVMKGIQNYSDQVKSIDDKIKILQNEESASRTAKKLLGGEEKNYSAEIKQLEDQKAFASRSMNQAYNAEADRASGDIVSKIKNSFDGSDWHDIYDNPDKHVSKNDVMRGLEKEDAKFKIKSPLEWNKGTHQLTDQSDAWVRKQVDDYLNAHPNDVINFRTSGDAATGKRNYPEVAQRVVDHLNSYVPVKHAQDKFSKEFLERNPQLKPIIDHQKEISNYFSKQNVEKADALANSFMDKGFIDVKEKYWGNNGLITKNQKFIDIQHRFAEAVAGKTMTEEVAKKNIESEIEQNPDLKKIYDNQLKEVQNLQNKARGMRESFLINGLKKINPDLGSLSLEDSKKLMDEYNKGLAETTGKFLHDKHTALELNADEKAKRVGAFFSNIGESMDAVQGSFSKWWFDKTKWGGDDLRFFQATKDNIPVTRSDEAKKWNWKGMSSLIDYKFYMSKIGQQLPLFAGAIGVTAATRGAGLPEYIGWIGSAGLFDAQMALENYNQIATAGVDKFGNKLTEMDAASAAANQFKETILPDMLFMAINAGVLSRAKNVVKPSALKTIGKAAANVAVGAIPMTWQGYLGYANALEAQGKTPDIWDYAQDGNFAKSLIDGVIGGGVLQLAHVPSEHFKQVDNWRKLIERSSGEFKDNALFSAGLQQEMRGLGNQLRDVLKIKIGSGEYDPREMAEDKNLLLYMTAVDRNVQGGGIDVKDVNGAYQAHNLALADLHDKWAEQNSENKNLSKIYADQAKDFRENAKKVMEGKAKYHYLIDANGNPIFISDESFKVMDKEGKIADLMKDGLIDSVHSSDDPAFAREYAEKTKSPEIKAEEPIKGSVGEDDTKKVVELLRDNKNDIKGSFKMQLGEGLEKPELHETLVKEILSQINDVPEVAKENLGENLYNQLKPFVDKQKEASVAEKKDDSVTDVTGQDESINNTILDQPPSKEKIPFDKFREQALTDFTAPLDKWSWRITSTMPTKERQKGVEDIRAGNDTAAARKVEAAIKEMYESGAIAMNRGAGPQVENRDWTFEELGMMQDVIKDVEPHVADWLRGESEFTPEEEQFLNDNFQNIIDETEPTGENQQPSSQTKTEGDQTGGTPPGGEESSGQGEGSEDEGSGIRHADTSELREEYGLGEYEKQSTTDAALDAQADEAIKKGYDVGKLISRMEKGSEPNAIETTILKKYVASLEATIEKNPTDANLKELKRVVEATDKSGSREALAFRARKGLQPKDDSLAGYFIQEMEAHGVEKLTENQKESLQKEHTDIQKAQKDFEEGVSGIKAKDSEKNAEEEVKKVKSKTPKTKRTHEDFVKERSDIVAHMREKLRQSRGETQATFVPFAKELVAIAPDVAKLVKNLVEEGVTKLGDIVKDIHGTLKEDIKDITEKDVHDIIAGVYNAPKKTKTETQIAIQDLRTEAKLINKLEALELGEEPKSEKGKQDRNKEIADLQKQIKDYRETLKSAGRFYGEDFSPEQKKIQQRANQLRDQITKMEDDLKTGNIAPDKPKTQPLKLDRKTQELQDKLIKLRLARRIRLLKAEYANRGNLKKAGDMVTNILNVPRTIMASVDYSAPLRQGVVASIAHPIEASKAFVEMFRQSVSQKRFDRWFSDLRDSPIYEVMEKSRLYVSDPHNPVLSAKEEQFMSNLAEKIPLVGKTLIKGSERAYTAYLNKLRVDLFTNGIKAFEAQGKTFENSPDLYKSFASWVNVSTGRGSLGPLERASEFLNTGFFSPRLIASRLQSFNPVYYAQMPKEIRIRALADMAKFISFGMTTISLAALAGAEVEANPLSTDFGKIKVGDTRYDIWGGFQQYIRFFSQVFYGATKSTRDDRIKELDGKHGRRDRLELAGGFLRGKAAPVPGLVMDWMAGKTPTGQKFSIGDELESHLTPLIYQDVKDVVKDDPDIAKIFSTGMLTAFGVGVQTYDSKKPPNQSR